MSRMFTFLRRISVNRHYCSQPTSQLVDSLAATIKGLDRNAVAQLLDSAPQLTKYVPKLWQQTYQLLAQEGVNADNFLTIVAGHPEVLAQHPNRLASSLDCWRSCQFGDKQMQILLAAHPQLLEIVDHNQLAQRVAFLHSHFLTRKNVWRLFLNSPNLVVDDQSTIKSKIDYLLQRMRIEVLDVIKSCAFSADLDTIRCRHVFLERLGLFKPRELKAEPGDPCNNPKLHQITDTTDKRFAVKVAYVTLEEYEVFQELFHREWNQSRVEDGDIEDTNNDYEEFVEDDKEKRKRSYRKTSNRKKSSG